MLAQLQFAINPFTLQPLFQNAQGLVDIIVADDDLHGGWALGCSLHGIQGQSPFALHGASGRSVGTADFLHFKNADWLNLVESGPAAFRRSSVVDVSSLSLRSQRLRTRRKGRGKSRRTSEPWPNDRSIHLFVHGEGRRPFVGAIGAGGANGFSVGHQLH